MQVCPSHKPCCFQEERALATGYQGARRQLLKPLQNLFLGEYNGKGWRRFLDSAITDPEYAAMPISLFLKMASEGCLLEETLDRLPGVPKPDIFVPRDQPFLCNDAQ